MKLYMISLAGRGYTSIRLVRQDGWDALDDGIFSDEMIADFAKANGQFDGEIARIECLKKMEGDSPDNDVALNLPAVYINGVLASFGSVSDVTKFLRDNPEIEIMDEYEGIIR